MAAPEIARISGRREKTKSSDAPNRNRPRSCASEKLSLGALVRFQDALRQRHHRSTIRRELYGMRVAREQAPANLLLKTAHMLAQRRLTEPKRPCRLAEALGARDREKASQHHGIEHAALIADRNNS